jgi:hypothetical protein
MAYRAFDIGLPFEATGRTPRNPNNPIAINNEIRNQIYPESTQIRGTGIPSDGSLETANYDSNYLNYLLGNPTQEDKRVDDTTLSYLRSQLEKLQNDKTCGKFLNSVIRQIQNKIHGTNIIPKFEGNIVENFDRINKAGGFWIANITSRGRYNSDRQAIRFGKNSFKPYDDSPLYYEYDIKKNELIEVEDKLNTGRLKNSVGLYSTTQKFESLSTLVHELIHAYYPKYNDIGMPVDHLDMNIYGIEALKELDIPAKMTNIKEPNGKTFNAALVQACSHVKL